MGTKLKEFIGNVYFWVVGIFSFLLAYCYYLMQRNKNLQTQIDMGEHKAEIDKFTERLKNAEKESNDAVSDYKRVRDGYIASDEGDGGTTH